MNIHDKTILESYKNCQELANSHYENFPVASFLLPKQIRKTVAAIYAFARIADDISDEGQYSKEQRISMLDDLEQFLDSISRGEIVTHKYFCALSHSVHFHSLPIELLYNLLHAFRQDVYKTTYESMGEVLEYCKYSANPIGRLLLHICNEDEEKNLLLSDNLCTSFQLINFSQDVHLDLLDRNRCYIPQDMLDKYKISTSEILNYTKIDNFSELMSEFVSKSKNIFNNGKNLAHNISGKFGLEIKATVVSVEEIISALEKRKSPYDRPYIKKSSFVKILIKSMFFSLFYSKLDATNAKPQSILS